ncbi:hypothetical protein AB0D12_11765 [Streptomyces sp. NPDC048479]
MTTASLGDTSYLLVNGDEAALVRAATGATVAGPARGPYRPVR